MWLYNVKQSSISQVVNPGKAIQFDFIGVAAGGLRMLTKDSIQVKYAGDYYLVSSSNIGKIAITNNGTVIDSTIWATGVVGLTLEYFLSQAIPT